MAATHAGTSSPTLAWFRLDLRLADNPALLEAIERKGPVIPVFIWAPEDETPWSPGAASRWWLHQSLTSLDAALREHGSRLTIRRGPAAEVLRSLARETGAGAVTWSRRYEPGVHARDRAVADALHEDGIEAVQTGGNLLFEPESVHTAAGRPFQVFTAFWRACMAAPAIAPMRSAPRKIPGPAEWTHSLDIAELKLQPAIASAGGLQAMWKPGEAGARAALRTFVKSALGGYAKARDIPGEPGTSRLSPHLHFGELGPRQVWYSVREAAGNALHAGSSAETFLREIGWREFAHHLLHHFPRTIGEPLREQFSRFPWRSDAAQLGAWQQGRTGYPIVDAGMRELRQTGWMHNRVRMIVASFLVKHLLIRWQDGAAWFWDTLVDADLACNTLGWQWTAGSGADAAPYFRVLNPVLQGEKFDAKGAYVGRWVPELSRAPAEWIHKPWTATPIALAAAGIELGVNYPRPLVDHAAARERALEAFQALKFR